MTTRTLDSHIEITPGTCGGKPRIAGRRISVHDIAVWHERMGQSVEEIAAGYDLALADVYAALAYYFDHRDEIDRQLAEEEAFIEDLRQKMPPLPQRQLKERPEHAKNDSDLHG